MSGSYSNSNIQPITGKCGFQRIFDKNIKSLRKSKENMKQKLKKIADNLTVDQEIIPF